MCMGISAGGFKREQSMKFKLLDFEGTPTMVDIPDDTKIISGVILSGDMVMNCPIHADSSICRMADYYDGDWMVPADTVKKWNGHKNKAYAIIDFTDEEAL